MVIANFRPEFTPPWLGTGQCHAADAQPARPTTGDRADRQGRRWRHAPRNRSSTRSSPRRRAFHCSSRRSLGRSSRSGTPGEHDGRYHLEDADAPFAIPATLQDSLVARLDRLGTAKDVALAASIIGQEFSFEIVGAAASVEPTLLTVALEQLVQSDIVTQRGEPPQAVYNFKHALIRDAAYQTVLKSRKRHLHQRVAETLESRFPDLARTEPELLAHHYSEADVVDRALDYLAQGGRARLRKPGPR